jgi:hypothetical protein
VKKALESAEGAVNPLFAVFYNVAATQAFQAALSTACGHHFVSVFGPYFIGVSPRD